MAPQHFLLPPDESSGASGLIVPGWYLIRSARRFPAISGRENMNDPPDHCIGAAREGLSNPVKGDQPKRIAIAFIRQFVERLQNFPVIMIASD